MKKNSKILIGIFAAITLLSFACKSKPEPVPPVKPAPEPEKPAPETKIDPETEELFAKLKQIEGEDGRLNAARLEAISLKADITYPEQFSVAEDIAKEAAELVKSGKLKEAVAKYNEAIDRYNTLSNLMRITAIKNEIDEYGFASYNPSVYADGEKLFTSIIEHYGSDYKTAKETSLNCIAMYEKVLNSGYYELAKKMRATALEAKSDCDSIKVARSRTEDYNKAVRLFNAGQNHSENQDYKKSFEAYKYSAENFMLLYNDVLSKRTAAEKAIAEAAAKQQESAELALEADKESPLSEAAEGFENSDLNLEDKSSPISREMVESINTGNTSESKKNSGETEKNKGKN